MIDQDITKDWADDVLAAIQRFKQGDLIPRPPFAFGVGAHALWGSPSERDGLDHSGQDGTRIWESHVDDGPAWGIITSQTCDLAEQGRPTQPWFQVSPVYQLDGDEDAVARLLRKQYVVPLTSPALTEAGCWVADLRIEIPVEKSFLVGVAPLHGFATDHEAESFGVAIGRRRGRPALSNQLAESVIRKIGKKKSNNRNLADRVFASVRAVRLDIEAGSQSAPTVVRLHVVCDGEPSAEVRDWFAKWEQGAQVGAHNEGIELLGTVFHDAAAISLDMYERTVDLDAA